MLFILIISRRNIFIVGLTNESLVKPASNSSAELTETGKNKSINYLLMKLVLFCCFEILCNSILKLSKRHDFHGVKIPKRWYI